MKRRLTLLTVAIFAVTETYRRGYGAALLFGGKQWAAALDPRATATTELDYMA